MARNGFLHFLFGLVDTTTDYQIIKKDPELRPVVTKFGTRGIIWSSVLLVLTPLILLGLRWAIEALNSSSVFVAVLVLVLLGACLIGMVLPGVINALVYTICQLKLNKKATGWVSLALLILLIIEILVVAFLVIA